MAVKYLAGDRLIGTAAERAALTTSPTEHSQTDTGAPTQNDFSDVSMMRSKMNTGHATIGSTITRVDINIGKAAASNTNGTGTLTVKFYDASATSYVTMGTLDTSVLTHASPALYTFSSGSITIAAGDWLEVTYGTGGQGGYDFRPTLYNNNDGLSGNETLAYMTGTPNAGSWVEVSTGLMSWIGYGSSVYPNLPNGAIFEESDTGDHHMFDGTNTWNEVT